MDFSAFFSQGNIPELRARIAANGYHLIPAKPFLKEPDGPWTPWYQAVLNGTYDYNMAFDGKSPYCGCAIMCGKVVSVVDGDTHVEEGDIMTLLALQMLMLTEPRMFDGVLYETTQSGGLHTYFGGIDSEHNGAISMWAVGDRYAAIEILTGKKLCYCYPTVTTRGAYKIGERSILNTRPEELPELSHHFIDRFGKAARDVADDEDLPVRRIEFKEDGRPDPSKLVGEDFPVIIDHYMATYFHKKRHVAAYLLTKTILGLEPWGYTTGRSELESLAAEYIRRRGRGLSDEGEAQRIVKNTMKESIEPALIPWVDVWEARRKRARSNMASIGRRTA